MMTIAEFAELCGTTKDTLRWYDKLGLLRPALIGENGYRYYDMAQYEEYDLINILKESGSNLDEICSILSNKKEYLNGVFFTDRLARLDEQRRRLEAMRELTQSMVDGFRAMDTCHPGEPVLINLDGTWLIEVALDKVHERDEDDYVKSLVQLQQAAEAAGLNGHPYPVGIKLSIQPAMNKELEQTHFFCFAKDGSSPNAVFQAGGPAVVIWHRGLYARIFDTLQIAFEHIHQLGLRPCDAIYESDYLTALSDKPENTTFLFTIPVVRDEL